MKKCMYSRVRLVVCMYVCVYVWHCVCVCVYVCAFGSMSCVFGSANGGCVYESD